MTRDKLGFDAGIAASTIAKLESSSVSEPGLFTVWAICKALQYHLDDLFDGLDYGQSRPEVRRGSELQSGSRQPAREVGSSVEPAPEHGSERDADGVSRS